MKIAQNLFKKTSHQQMATLRILSQGFFTIFCLWVGYRFYLFFLWATSKTDNFVPRPPSVEGFLPISALVGLKRLILTGQYDMVHPAGLTILLSILLIAFFFRKGFCGWICPIGFISNLAEKGGRYFNLTLRLPVWLNIPLLSLKYLLLSFFIYIIFFKMTLAQIQAFHKTAYNLAADAKMLIFFLSPSGLTIGVLLFLILISFFIRNFWCRFLCPYGALLGLFAMLGPCRIKRKEENCIDCRKCEKICPGSIKITNKKTLATPECIGCMECAAICPVDDCLKLSMMGSIKQKIITLPAMIILLFIFCWGIAVITGHWYTEVSPEIMKQVYSRLTELPHPGL